SPGQGSAHSLAPGVERLAESLAEAFVTVRKLGGQVPHGAPAHAVPGPLSRHDRIEERVDLGQWRPSRIPEHRLEGPLREEADQPVQDGVAELFLRPEVVIEVTFPGSALPEDVLEAGPVVPPNRHEAGGHLNDLLANGGTTLAHLCTDRSVHYLRERAAVKRPPARGVAHACRDAADS